MIFPAEKFVLSMIIPIFAIRELAKPLNDAQMCGSFFVHIRSLSKYANGKIAAFHETLYDRDRKRTTMAIIDIWDAPLSQYIGFTFLRILKHQTSGIDHSKAFFPIVLRHNLIFNYKKVRLNQIIPLIVAKIANLFVYSTFWQFQTLSLRHEKKY